MRRTGVGRDHHPARDVVLEVRDGEGADAGGRGGSVEPRPNHRLGVADAGGHPKKKSYASCESDGSIMGNPAATA